MKNFVQSLLEEKGLKYEDLNYTEKEYIKNLNLGQQGYSLADFKDALYQLKDQLAMELCDTPSDQEHAEKNVLLKARLKNYMILYAKLVAPQKAQEALERALENKRDNEMSTA